MTKIDSPPSTSSDRVQNIDTRGGSAISLDEVLTLVAK